MEKGQGPGREGQGRLGSPRGLFTSTPSAISAEASSGLASRPPSSANGPEQQGGWI